LTGKQIDKTSGTLPRYLASREVRISVFCHINFIVFSLGLPEVTLFKHKKSASMRRLLQS